MATVTSVRDDAPTPVGSALREALHWLRRHWAHFALAPAMVIAFTVIHEAAHAAVALLQGGRILEFVVWPAKGVWGYVRYQLPGGSGASSLAIGLAPYLLWAASFAAVGLLARLRRRWPFWLASTLFLWCFVGAFGDIFNAWLGWVLGLPNDFYRAFGPAGVGGVLALVVTSLLVGWAGFGVQRRLYGSAALGHRAYTLLLLAGAGGGALAFLLFRLLSKTAG